MKSTQNCLEGLDETVHLMESSTEVRSKPWPPRAEQTTCQAQKGLYGALSENKPLEVVKVKPSTSAKNYKRKQTLDSNTEYYKKYSFQWSEEPGVSSQMN